MVFCHALKAALTLQHVPFLGTFKGTYTMTKLVTAENAAVTVVAGIEVLTKDVIKGQQDGIKKALTKLDMNIHMNAVQCMIHASIHGDTSLMRRLLVEVIDAQTGYRRQGLINWMRKFSPMELKGDIINLSGLTPEGEKRPFKIEEANATPFWTDQDNNEKVAKPVYQDTLMAGINRSIRDFNAAVANTVEGKPIDPTKPFYDGVKMAEVADFMAEVEKRANALPKDNTREVRQAQEKLQQVLAAG
jgi:hypothetical protein